MGAFAIKSRNRNRVTQGELTWSGLKLNKFTTLSDAGMPTSTAFSLEMGIAWTPRRFAFAAKRHSRPNEHRSDRRAALHEYSFDLHELPADTAGCSCCYREPRLQ